LPDTVQNNASAVAGGWAEDVIYANLSAIEHEPADLVAQLLVVKHEFPDFFRKLRALPFALKATRFLSLTVVSRFASGSDCVSRRTQFVSCHMGYRHCLASGEGS
jgi:hypothetical protein